MDGKGLVPPGLRYLADNIISKNNILGASRATKARWAKGLKLPREQETIFFAGCGYQYTSELESLMSLIRRIDKSAVSTELTMSFASFQKRLGIDAAGILSKIAGRGSNADNQPLQDAVKVLSNLGVEFGYLGEDEPCCGGLLYYIGLNDEFNKNAQRVYDKFKASGVKRIISIVPSCTHALRELIPNSVGRHDIEVKHFTEVVAENIAAHELRYPGEVKVTYHDPCQLVRYLGVVDEPRQILRAIKGIELVEPEWTKGEWATCCGGGGGFEVVLPELSEILAVNRARELVETGADMIVSNCPGCVMQLKTGIKGLKSDGVEVLDLTQIIVMSMEA